MLFSNRFLTTQIVFVIAALTLFFFYKTVSSGPALPVYGSIADFQLIDQNKKNTSIADLKGKVWVADFVFTTCSGICPMMGRNMARMNNAFAKYSDVRMVSISVNPENDTPDVLKAYANKLSANDQWLFLTGSRDSIQKLAVESFKIGDMKEIMFHSAMFVLVDRKGKIRGYYNSEETDRLTRLNEDVRQLRQELYLPLLPTINASLNALAGLCLFMGFRAIRRKDILTHRKWMISALVCSSVFLCAYVYFHLTTHILTRYPGHGIWKLIYLTVLGTHTPLAVLIVPFILIALRHALRGEFGKHVKITRWLYPTWMYVSITGVIVYLMLYVFKAA